MRKYFYIILGLYALSLPAQKNLEGRVLAKDGYETVPLIGASVYWMDTQTGTITDDKGAFSIPYLGQEKRLIMSYLGFKSDTLSVNQNKLLTHFLDQANSAQLDEVTLIQRRKSLQKSYFEAQNIIKINSEELLKAACCNLSESFETNPSIDVNFSDALTGTKQIRMLGLTSPYLLITEENIPMVRGASQAYGLSFTPGTWIESIQITKGTGSVVNGYESIAGQINTEIKKPFSDAPLFFNLYTSVN